MRVALMAATVLAAGMIPAAASQDSGGRLPTFNECNDLGWVRGVHNEIQGELSDWMAQCLIGQIPFSHDADRDDTDLATVAPKPAAAPQLRKKRG